MGDAMIVMKFGGTSLADRSRMEHVAGIVGRHDLSSVVVVVSAMGSTTDRLIQAAALAEQGDQVGLAALIGELGQFHRSACEDQQVTGQIDGLLNELFSVLEGIRLLREQTPRSRDLVSSIGERLSSQILAAHLRLQGTEAEAVDARRFVVTDEQYNAARVDLERTREAALPLLSELLQRGVVPVVTGFIGATPSGITTTLGRGGSDYTAALVGSMLGAKEVWIWTDVSGILTADPRLVKEARPLERVSYREAAEMSYFGAKVLHPKTIGPAVSAQIPIRIKNTFDPDLPGTVVAETSPTLPQGVKTVSSIHGLALITVEGRGMSGVPGVARRVFEATEETGVNVVMISQASSEQTISFVVPADQASPLINSLKERFALELATGIVDRITAQREIAILSIVGQGMAGRVGISGRLFATLGAVEVNVVAIAQGASELSISVAIEEADARRAVRAVHTAFGLTRTINLFVLGCGRVGQTFLRQLAETRSTIEKQQSLELKLIGLSDSKQLLLDDSGIDPTGAQERLQGADARPRPSDAELVERLHELHFTDLVLVDLTAADTADLHRQALEAGIHVVTANKRPLSGPQKSFAALQAASRSSGARLCYETTFGAGLPVLHTLQELINTGDSFRSISGCFSGTLGFICTRLEQGAELAEAVRAATEQGLTEPDPREDLSGRDVARKALIIARTAGMQIEPEAIQLKPLIADLDMGLDEALALHGQSIAQQVSEQGRQGCALRYVAQITPEAVEVGLRAVPVKDPIGTLRGQDNILVYRTERYNEFPLVIRGPGAGAEVTAAGVLGDVLRVARRGAR